MAVIHNLNAGARIQTEILTLVTEPSDRQTTLAKTLTMEIDLSVKPNQEHSGKLFTNAMLKKYAQKADKVAKSCKKLQKAAVKKTALRKAAL